MDPAVSHALTITQTSLSASELRKHIIFGLSKVDDPVQNLIVRTYVCQPPSGIILARTFATPPDPIPILTKRAGDRVAELVIVGSVGFAHGKLKLQELAACSSVPGRTFAAVTRDSNATGSFTTCSTNLIVAFAEGLLNSTLQLCIARPNKRRRAPIRR